MARAAFFRQLFNVGLHDRPRVRQQAVDVFSPSGVEGTFASGLTSPYGIADLQSAPASTPEPGNLFLLGSGIAMIALARVRIHH